MAALPLRNSSLETQELSGGELALIIPRRNTPVIWLLSLVFMIPKKRQVVLDAVGARVWRLCDGEHTVAELIGAVQEEYRLNRKEAEASITTYLRRLGKRGLVAFAVRKEEGS